MTNFRYTAGDFVAAQRLHALPTRRGWVIFAAFMAAIFGGFMLLDPDAWQEPWPLLASILAGGVAFVSLWFLYIPMRARRNFRRYPLAQLNFGFELKSEGIGTRSERGASTILWKDIVRWRFGRGTVLVYIAPRLFLIFPERLAAQGFPLQELQAALAREVGPAAR